MENIHTKKILENFENVKILIIGDIILDHYLYGKVNRINPEAPVPIVEIQSEKYILGGAANVAANVASLSGNPTLLGFIGEDEAGEKIIELTKKEGIKFIPNYTNQTIEKTRITSGNHHLIRIDKEEKSQKFFDIEILKEELEKADIVVVSDYAKGAITPQLMNILLESDKKIIIDPKPKNKELYKGCYLITPNQKEALEISNLEEALEAGKWLQKNISSKVIVTRGPEGMITFDEKIKSIPTYAKEVYDVSGAGDTVMATISLALSSGATLEQSAIIANHAAGIVLTKLGTAKATLKELKQKLFKENKKIKSFEEIKEMVEKLRSENKKIIWTNGCFDLLHQGHVDYLQKAKGGRDVLILGLNSDESIRRLKGPERPIQSEKARAEILAALECVDHILIFQEITPEKYIKELEPDFFIKGGDYTIKTMSQNERKIVESYGGKIMFIPQTEGMSTTNLIEKIKRNGSLAKGKIDQKELALS